MATVLIGVDKSEASTRAVEFALDRAAAEDLQLVVAHVINWSPFSFNTNTENEERPARRRAEIKAADEQVIAPMVSLIEAAGRKASTQIRHGHPSETLIDIAEEVGASHIVVGRTGDSGLREAIFGSVVMKLVHVSPLPVTVVP